MNSTRFKMVKERHRKSFEKAVREGKMDAAFKPLCEFISSSKDFYTSSCCSGRILLLGLPQGERKKDAYFHRKWHSTISFEEVWEALQEKTLGELWLKLEPFIMHVGCRNLEGAKKIMAIMKKAGVKRGGIIVAKEGKFLVEFDGTQEMSLPVKKEEKILVQKDYLKETVEKANKKLEKNYEMIERLEKEMRKGLK